MELVARLTQSVRARLRSLEGIEAGLVVAVSGGPDSVALVRLLVAARAPEGGRLMLAHLNHGLRGSDSDADEQFVAALHAGLVAAGIEDVHLRCAKRDVLALAREAGANVEGLARQVRYRWLTEVAREEGVRWVATGHTANDQAETVLHRLLRGTGLQGLRGIAAQRPLEDGVSVVRPLLDVTRAEVLACLEALGQPAREDASNRDLRYTRNRIRHELLPHLAERYNPAIVTVLGRLAAQAEEATATEEAAALDLLQATELPRAGALLIFDRGRLAVAPRWLVRALFRRVWLREGWPMGEMSYTAWDRLAGLVAGEARGVDLPGHISARCLERVVQVGSLTRGPR